MNCYDSANTESRNDEAVSISLYKITMVKSPHSYNIFQIKIYFVVLFKPKKDKFTLTEILKKGREWKKNKHYSDKQKRD